MGWLSGWGYRKSVTLSRASGAVTNYQMKILVGESSGATGEDVDCGGHCLSSFNDLRFTNSDGLSLLDYWIESISGTTPNQLATVWVEFDSVGTGATTFYMYYGKSGAAAASSGANTFIAFDDFERGSDGDTVGGSWTEVYAHAHISTEQYFGGTRSCKLIGATGSGQHPIMTIPVTPSANISIRFRVRKNETGYLTIGHGDGSSRAWWYYQDDENIRYLASGGGYSSVLGSAAKDTWHLFEFNNFDWSANTYDIWVNDSKIGPGSTEYPDSEAQNILYLRGQNVTGADTWIDNVIVRNFRTTGPAWGAWGSEESKIYVNLGVGESVFEAFGVAVDIAAILVPMGFSELIFQAFDVAANVFQKWMADPTLSIKQPSFTCSAKAPSSPAPLSKRPTETYSVEDHV